MIKLKKNILRLFCMVLCSCLFFGCNGNREVPKEPEEKNVAENVGIGVEDTKDSENNKKSEIAKNPENNKDSEIIKTPEGNKESETAKNPENADEVQNVSFEVFENYKEKNIPSVYTDENPNEQYCNVIFNENKEIEYYTIAKEDDGYYIWKYTLAENEKEDSSVWEREAVSWLNGLKKQIDSGRVTVFLGEDSNYYAWYIDREEQTHLVKKNENSFTEIQGLDLRRTDFKQIAVLKNGNIVSADMGKECFVYQQEDGSLLTNFPCGWYEGMGVKGNQIYIADKTQSYIQNYDAQKQEFQAAIKAGFNTPIRIAFQGEDLYICCAKGIYHAKTNEDEFQKIMDAGNYHFAIGTTTLLKFFVRGNIFYIVYGEDGGCIKKYAPAKEGDKAEKYLTVYSLGNPDGINNDVILDMISEFQTKYPDTEIIYETGRGAEGSITVSDRIRALNARILAGDGPDVLVLDGLPAKSYIEKGILADLTPVLAERKEELLPGILSAYSMEDKIYMLPLRFKVPVFITCGQEKETYSSLDALVKYSEENGGGIMQSGYSYTDFFEMLYYNYRPEILQDGMVNKKNLEHFLELTKRFCESEGITENTVHLITYMEGYSMPSDLIYEKAKFMFVNLSGGSELSEIPSIVEYLNGEMIGNDDGVFFPKTLLGVNALSEKRELAYLFFEFALSYEIQDRYVPFSGYPIDEKILDKFAQWDLSHIITSGGENGEIEFRYFTKEQSSQVIQIVKEIHTPFTVDASIWEIMEEEAMGYLKGEKKLEDCVDAIASRIQLYLYEQ